MATAAKNAGLKHVIWSTLEDTRKWSPLSDSRIPTLHGKYKVPHFDAKGESNHFFSDLGVPTTFLLTSFYWDNFVGFGMGPQKGPDGKLAITLPMGDKKLPGIAAEDIGKCAYGVFKRGSEFIGKTVGIAGENPTGAQMAAGFAELLGKEVAYNSISPEVVPIAWIPRRGRLGQHVPVQARFQRILLRSARCRVFKIAQLRIAGFQNLAQEQQECNPRNAKRRECVTSWNCRTAKQEGKRNAHGPGVEIARRTHGRQPFSLH